MRAGGKRECFQLLVRENSRKSKGFNLLIGLAYSFIAYKPRAPNSKPRCHTANVKMQEWSNKWKIIRTDKVACESTCILY